MMKISLNLDKKSFEKKKQVPIMFTISIYQIQYTIIRKTSD